MSPALDRDEEIWDSYNEAVQAVIDFRSYHIQIVTKWVQTIDFRS